jgi:hypothetical protein
LKSYDEIKAILDLELSDAMERHEREGLNWHHTGKLLAEALEHYNRFTLHGMIPEDLKEDDE